MYKMWHYNYPVNEYFSGRFESSKFVHGEEEVWSFAFVEKMAERKDGLDLGHNGAGDDCLAQVIKYGGGAAAAGRWALIGCFTPSTYNKNCISHLVQYGCLRIISGWGKSACMNGSCR